MAAVDGFGLVGELVGGKHLIEAVVAEGGFGTVYRGQQKALKRPVAVKVLKVPTEMTPTMRTAFLESFEREAQTIAQQGCGERLTAPCFLGEETVRPWPGGWARSS